MNEPLTKLQLAAYDHVDSMVPQADEKDAVLLWRGWALRESFEAGARWQENELATKDALLVEARAILSDMIEHPVSIEYWQERAKNYLERTK